jgi:putative tryptophan/tyrosine transport system substrate-binding protein
MKRRNFIAGIAATTTWPILAHAQKATQKKTIGLLLNFSPTDPEAISRLGTIQARLQSLGWSEGQNLRTEVRWGFGNTNQIKTAAKELVSLNVDALLAHTTPATAALLDETKSIPVVFVNVSDPIGNHFVTSFKEPRGNATGFTNLEFSLGGKWISLLKEIVPVTRSAMLMFNPDVTPFALEIVRSADSAAASLEMVSISVPVRNEEAIEGAFATSSGESAVGLVVFPDSFLTPRRKLVVGLAAEHRIPTVYPFKYWVQSGGLVSYGSETSDLYRNAAWYISRILKGEDPHHLPVVSPTVYELAVNLRTAKAMGLTVPPAIIGRADDVIE